MLVADSLARLDNYSFTSIVHYLMIIDNFTCICRLTRLWIRFKLILQAMIFWDLEVSGPIWIEDYFQNSVMMHTKM